jgi:putative sterol carrier protein
VLQLHFDHGSVHVRQGEAANPDATFYTDMPVYMRLIAGALQPEEAVAEGLVRVQGDPAKLARFLHLCGFPLSG